jgi:phosphate/sulfate permease
MMDVARHGIFNPSFFTFQNVMCIYLAVVISDVFLLDLFNSLGLPTSTTVSMVFELLGASFITALLASSGGGLGMLNTDKAMTIIFSIFLSVAIAFIFGLIVQWISRVIFTFHYKKNLGRKIGLYGGFASTAILYFMIVKGMKGSSLKALLSADAVVGAQPFNETPAFRVTEEMVQNIKEGAIIIDLNASQGGCFETTRLTDLNNPVFRKHGVVHYCVPNVPSLVARTASISLSNILIPELLAIGDSGGVDHYIKSSQGFRRGVYFYHGILTNKDVGDQFNLPVKDIDLLLAAF